MRRGPPRATPRGPRSLPARSCDHLTSPIVFSGAARLFAHRRGVRGYGWPAPDPRNGDPGPRRCAHGPVLSGSSIIDLKLLPKLRHPLPITVAERGGELLLDLGTAPIVLVTARRD